MFNNKTPHERIRAVAGDFKSNYEIILIRLLDFFQTNDLIVIDEKLNVLDLKYKLFEEIITSY